MRSKLLWALGVLLTLITMTAPACAADFAWVYQDERLGAVDATTFVLPDGTYRQLYGSTLLGRFAAANSNDGLHWTDEGSAGLPVEIGGRVTQFRDGRYRLYWGSSSLRAFTSVDGRTWQEEPPASIVAPEPSCTSCVYYGSGDVAIMPDGSYRMYYERRDPSPHFPDGGVSNIVSATSTDGLVWQKDLSWRSDVFVGPETIAGAFHPRVIKLPDNTYKMFFWTDGAILSATSQDGQTWTDRKYENVMGGDPDILMLPDGRIVLFVNWRDTSLPSTNLAVQRMWTYVWQQVPFAFGPFDPTWNNLQAGQTVSGSLPITGVLGNDVRLTATSYSNKGVFAGDDPASPIAVQLAAAPGATAVQITVTAQQQVSSYASGYVLVVADDGTTRVSTSVRFLLPASVSTPNCTLTASPSTITLGSSATLTATCTPAATVYAWTPATGLVAIPASGATATVTPTAAGVFQYSVTGSNAGGTSNPAATSVIVASATSISDSECFFDWAERTYSGWFSPAGAISSTSAPYYYRYYPQTSAYLATSFADNRVYYLGPLSNSSVLEVGALSGWLSSAGCQ